jgi:hypothetical protein
MAKTKTKTLKQTRYLLSKVSPLTPQEKTRLKSELHSGAVKVKKTKIKTKKK